MREALDRFTAVFMSNQVGNSFWGHVSGVTRAGLFVKLDLTGADGLIPISSLGTEYFDHEEDRHALVGRHTGRCFRLGDKVEVRLAEADKVTGSLRLELLRDEGRESRPALRRTGLSRKKDKKAAKKAAKKVLNKATRKASKPNKSNPNKGAPRKSAKRAPPKQAGSE